jgi:adenine-specific DNA-methyltransferase
LLEKDDRGNWVISKKYDATMLAAAVCKHEGFKFHPDQKTYWKQGYSTEKDFIFVTTQFLTTEQIQRIQDQMKPDENLLICAKAFKVPANKFDRITIKKIPQSLLNRGVEFGRNDYSLNVKEPIQEEMDMEIESDT